MEGLARITGLSDGQLIDALAKLAASERRAIALLVAALAEFDARRLYLGLGYSSLFAYCTSALRLSEQAAFNRIEAARASRRFPVILDCIEKGALSLTATRLLAPHLTDENLENVIEEARNKKTREVEHLVARLRPLPPVPSTLRKLPEPRAAAAATASGSLLDAAAGIAATSTQPAPSAPTPSPPPAPTPSRRPIVEPLSPAHYRLQVTLTKAAHDKLREAQALSRHAVPNGDPAAIIERALDTLLIQLRRAKFGQAVRRREREARPGKCADEPPRGRHIPRAVKRAVWGRDSGRCAFVSAAGRRCEETEFLEYHHVAAYARGGATTAENLELRCRAHNAYEAELEFGPRVDP